MGIPIPLGQLQVDPDYLATVSNAGPLQRDNGNWKENAATMTTRVPYNRVWYPFVTPWWQVKKTLTMDTWVDKQTNRH